MRGKFIVFEGIEGSGKSVQAKELQKSLLSRGADAIITEQPWEGDQIGKLIREELKDKVDAISPTTLQFLFMANRSNHVEKFIEPNLNEGRIVISDRYWMSTAAYGSAFSKEHGMDIGYFFNMNRVFPKPDMVFFIDVGPNVAYQRITDRGTQRAIAEGAKTERFDRLDMLKSLYKKYRELEKLYEGTWVNIDGVQPKDAVTNEILKSFDKFTQGKWRMPK